MGVIRGRPAAANFTTVPNEWLRDPRLCVEARALLPYVMSHSATYDLTIERIVSDTGMTVRAVRVGLRGLGELGYVVQTRRRGPDGRLGIFDFVVGGTHEAFLAAHRRWDDARRQFARLIGGSEVTT